MGLQEMGLVYGEEESRGEHGEEDKQKERGCETEEEVIKGFGKGWRAVLREVREGAGDCRIV